jgi:serine/threonine protein kinase
MGIWDERPTSCAERDADAEEMDGAPGAARLPTGLPTRYRVGAMVGRGGSATVWSARDTRTGDDVVVKVLAPSGVPVQRFDAEVRALGRLARVGGVVEVRAVGRSADGRPWLVEELVHGPTLADRLRAAPWPRVEVQRLVREVATALSAAHAAGVVHGDVAPANVLCRPDGALVLCDFGVALLGGTSDGPSPCTPSFAAPERRAGGPPTPQADVYGLAVLAWFACTGGLPPDRPGPPDGLPRRLGAALVRALGPDPRRRPTAAALARRAR